MIKKTNISVQDNRGIRVRSNMILGNEAGFSSGDILDANAVVELIKKYTAAIINHETTEVPVGTITSENILDGTIQMEDLSDEVKQKLDFVYDEEEDALHI